MAMVGTADQTILLHVRSPQCSNAYWSVTRGCYVRGVWIDWIFPPKSSVIHPDVWLEIVFFSFLDNYLTSGENIDINL